MTAQASSKAAAATPAGLTPQQAPAGAAGPRSKTPVAAATAAPITPASNGPATAPPRLPTQPPTAATAAAAAAATANRSSGGGATSATGFGFDAAAAGNGVRAGGGGGGGGAAAAGPRGFTSSDLSSLNSVLFDAFSSSRQREGDAEGKTKEVLDALMKVRALGLGGGAGHLCSFCRMVIDQGVRAWWPLPDQGVRARACRRLLRASAWWPACSSSRARCRRRR